MIGGVQCEVCGSNGKFTTGTAIVKRLDTIIKLLGPEIKGVTKASEGASDERFIDNGDGTISDTKTRLMWRKDGSKERLTYAQAEEFIAELNREEWTDWRLPTIEELFSLVDFTKREPAVNPMFECEKASYWSSTPVAGYSNLAWIVYFYDGNVNNNNRSNRYFVRPCRQY